MNERIEKSVYRKTEAGVTEVKTRKAGLDSKTRTLLILVNGALSVQDLANHIGYDPRQALAGLAANGLVERLDDAAPRAPTRAPAPATPTVTAAEAAPNPPLNLGPACQRAVQLLVPLYGPDAVAVVQPLLRAKSIDGFHQALGELESKLSVPAGRKRAAEMVAQIRGVAA
ncbi:hypothetical protein BurJ1DRAFT_1602 [Burkholderiales bacterium JOSHI_001]|nr:hypothetical protein BurJ1DRAFT_1602 [Burkholderiales bacterium JOSHI_001]